MFIASVNSVAEQLPAAAESGQQDSAGLSGFEAKESSSRNILIEEWNFVLPEKGCFIYMYKFKLYIRVTPEIGVQYKLTEKWKTQKAQTQKLQNDQIMLRSQTSISAEILS